MTFQQLDPSRLEELRQLGSSRVANAVETLGVRLRNTGFTDASNHCIFAKFPPMVGYAATLRIRTSTPPMQGESYFYRLDWLDHVQSVPAPRVLVIEDLDRHPGLGSFVGVVHLNILRALDCIGVVTNGAVRDVEAARAARFHMFAGNLSVSHAYAHIAEFGTPVQVGQMPVRPGDLLHGDRHGVQTLPIEIADDLPAVARRMIAEESEIIQLCQSGSFTLEKLRSAVAEVGAKRKSSTRTRT